MKINRNRVRWLPRFSLRTFAIAATLMCLYLGCWRPTCKSGVRDVDFQLTRAHLGSATPLAPLILAFDKDVVRMSFPARSVTIREYYFWLFGWTAKLPFTKEWTNPAVGSFPPVRNLAPAGGEDASFVERVGDTS
jgi:hypothetical protein